MKNTKSKRPKKYERQVLVVFSDTHAGHKYGLQNPETLTVDDLPYELNGNHHIERNKLVPVHNSPYQNWLWKVYEKQLQDTMDFADGDPVMVIHNGDLTQGIKYPEAGNGDLGSQLMVAASNMRPWFKHKNVKWFKLIWGTASHIFEAGSSTRLVYDALQKDFGKNVNITIDKHALINFFGVMVDVAHHGPGTSIRNWLDGNTARYYTKSLQYDYVDRDLRPPHLVYRGHYHVRVEEYVTKFYRKWGAHKTGFIMTPSYQGLNEYARQRTQSTGFVLNGHAATEIINGYPTRTEWFVTETDQKGIDVIK